MPFFTKKSAVVEAIQFTDASKDIACNFIQGDSWPDFDKQGNPILHMPTPEGVATASLGDWIIKEVSGECYPCKPEVFSQTYDAVKIEKPENFIPPFTTTGTPTQITWSIKTGTGTSTYPNGTVFIKE